jgi:mannosyl-oligosaccharide alpha-1,2-mannosidase
MITIPLSPRQRVPLRKAVYASLTLVACLLLLHISRNGYPSFKHRFEDSVPEDESAASPPVSAEEWNRRAERVKEAFRHAYHGYEKYAQPKDELRPVTNVGMSGFVCFESNLVRWGLR